MAALFESQWNGQTPGKRVFGLRVLSVDGRPINGLQAVLRNILRAVDMMPLVPLLAVSEGAAVLRFPPVVWRSWLRPARPASSGWAISSAVRWSSVRNHHEPRSRSAPPRCTSWSWHGSSRRRFTRRRRLARALAVYHERRRFFSACAAAGDCASSGGASDSPMGTCPPKRTWMTCCKQHTTICFLTSCTRDRRFTVSRREPLCRSDPRTGADRRGSRCHS